MKTLVIIQARCGSTRLPKKVLMPLAGKTVLERMVEHVLAVTSDFDVTVAATLEREDDAIEEVCKNMGMKCFRGHPTDVLDRHYQAAKGERADVVVKIPSDCPLIDPSVIGKVLSHFRQSRGRYEYVSNLHPATYPDGNDVEVMLMETLTAAWREATKPYEREHTTPFIWDQPERFRIGNVEWETGLNYSMTHRWTIDYPEDYQFVKAVYDELWSQTRPMFSLQDILNLLNERPDIHAINAQYAGENWYRQHLGELKTIMRDETRIFSQPNGNAR